MRRTAALLALAPLLAGCGGNAHGVLSETAARLGKIRSGNLSMSFFVTPRGVGHGRRFGYELHGPFALRGTGSLPLAHVEYTQTANGKSATVTFVSTGTRAYVVANGRQIAVPASALSGVGGSGGNGFSELRIDDWVKHPHGAGCKTKRQGSLECVDADLDVVNAVNDLAALARSVSGRQLPRIRGSSAKQLRDATKSARLHVESGKKDHLLRLLEIDADFGLDVPKELRKAFGNVVGAKVHFSLGVRDPNRPVHV